MLATVLDRTTPRTQFTSNNTPPDFKGYSPDISSAQDYYPFGMLMPGRYISDNTPQCVTTQTTVLVPRTVRVYIRDLEPVPPVRTNGYTPVVVETYPWTTPVRQVPLAATFADQQPYFYNYLPAGQHPDGYVARVVPGGGEYELDLSNEPSGLSLYLPFGIDTSAGGSNQVLGFGVGMLPAGVRMEARVRHYGADTSREEYNEVVRWRDVREGEQVELRFGLPAGSAGKLVAELSLSAEGGVGRFNSQAKVHIYNPWIEKTEWSTESRLVTLCDEKDKYRYGFNGQEKDNEVAGQGNHTTALFWEYDTRLGRRWNLDPKPNPSISSYAAFANNPIFFKDVQGDTIRTYSAIDIDDDGGYKMGKEMSAKGNLVVEALVRTKGGRDFLGQFALKGDKLGSHEFKEDGKYSKYTFDLIDVNMQDMKGNFPAMAEGGFTAGTNSTGDKPEFSLQLMSFRGDLPRLVETAGHELFAHGFGVAALIKAFENSGMKGYSSPKTTTSADVDHKALRDQDSKHPGYRLYNDFKSQLINAFPMLKYKINQTWENEHRGYQREYKNIK